MLNVYIPNNKTLKYINKNLTKEKNKYIIIVGHFLTFLLIDRRNRQSSWHIDYLNNTINQHD